jgi:hypothetical protein
VALAARSPNAEILSGTTVRTAEAVLLLFGLLGVAVAAFQWTVSPWFVALKQGAAEWLVNREVFWPLEDSPAWWLLTRQPEAGDVFSWLDGAAILVWIGGGALALGGIGLAGMRLAAWLAGGDWRRLALGLTPLAGIGLFLGLSMMSATHLRAEGASLGWLPVARGLLLALAVAWSGWLGARLIAAGRPGLLRGALALAAWLVPVVAAAAAWGMAFYVW